MTNKTPCINGERLSTASWEFVDAVFRKGSVVQHTIPVKGVAQAAYIWKRPFTQCYYCRCAVGKVQVTTLESFEYYIEKGNRFFVVTEASVKIQLPSIGGIILDKFKNLFIDATGKNNITLYKRWFREALVKYSANTPKKDTEANAGEEAFTPYVEGNIIFLSPKIKVGCPKKATTVITSPFVPKHRLDIYDLSKKLIDR